MKLHQLIPVIANVKRKAKAMQTQVHNMAQKRQVFDGLTRIYTPTADDGYVYPPESKPVVLNAKYLIEDFQEASIELYDLCHAQDFANASAKSDIKIDGQIIATDVPVTHLIFLEKQLTDVRTFIAALPLLPIDSEWIYDANKGCYRAPEKKSTKTKKITEFVVAYEATKEHPANIKEVTKDIPEGTWSSTLLSGALPVDTVNLMLNRVDTLINAVTQARGSANEAEVSVSPKAAALFEYLFAPVYDGPGTQA